MDLDKDIIIIILIIGLLSITWFKGNFIIDSFDFNFSYSRIMFFYHNLFNWDDTSLGNLNSKWSAFLVSYSSFLAFTEIVGFSLVFAEKLLFYFWFISAGLSMYYLSHILKIGKVGKLISALFYMMNPFSLVFIWNSSLGLLQIPYAFAPMILALYIYGLNNKKGISYILSISVFWFIITTTAYVNPTYAILHWGLIFSYLIYHILTQKNNQIYRCMKFTLILLILWVMLNSFWIFPTALELREMFREATTPIHPLQEFKQNSIYLMGALRLTGYWATETWGWYKGDSFYSWSPNYYPQTFLSALSFSIPILVFSSLLITNNKKITLYFSVLAIFALFLIKGNFPPFNEFNLWFFNSFSFLSRAFRHPNKYAILICLSYSLLLGIGTNGIYNFLQKRIKLKIISHSYLLIIFIIFFIALAFPFWTGDVIYPGGKIIPSARVIIPNYYKEANDWLNKNDIDFRILSLPQGKRQYIAYSWPSGFFGVNPSRWLLSRPNIWASNNISLMINKKIETSSYNNNTAKVLGLLSVKYVVEYKDIKWEYISGNNDFFNYDSLKLTNFLNSQNALNLEKTFGKLDFYEMNNLNFLPHVYTSNQFILTESVDMMFNEIEKNSFTPGNQILFLREQESKFEFLEQLPEYSASMKIESNDFNDYSFENSTWKNVEDCCNDMQGKAKVYASLSEDAIDDKKSLNLTSKNHCACVSQKFLSFDNKLTYKLSFDYKHVSGKNPWFCVWVSGCNKCIPLKNLENSTNWKIYEIYLIFPECAKSASLYFYSNSDGNQTTTNLYDNVKLEKIILTDKPVYHPQISFKKINPTKIQIKIQNATQPFFLVFSESYHPQWKVYLDKDFDCKQIAYYNNTNVRECKHETSFSPGDISYLLAKPLDDKNHFMVNGYANAWYINPQKIGKRDFIITLYFWPQSLFYLGLIISGTSFLACIGYLIYDWRKVKNHSLFGFRK
ncbi:MAG: hypothetical protein ISS28_01380 [Candidatus Cloacimonetes bacterium]|nr:hypothetical protein [Candidatus Cloacimonadota bacterium]